MTITPTPAAPPSNPISNFIAWFDGTKTYIALAVGALVIVVNHFVTIPSLNIDPANWIAELLALIPVATINHKLNRIENKLSP